MFRTTWRQDRGPPDRVAAAATASGSGSTPRSWFQRGRETGSRRDHTTGRPGAQDQELPRLGDREPEARDREPPRREPRRPRVRTLGADASSTYRGSAVRSPSRTYGSRRVRASEKVLQEPGTKNRSRACRLLARFGCSRVVSSSTFALVGHNGSWPRATPESSAPGQRSCGARARPGARLRARPRAAIAVSAVENSYRRTPAGSVPGKLASTSSVWRARASRSVARSVVASFAS